MLVVIRGTTAAGKTSVGQRVSQRIGCAYLEPELFLGHRKFSPSRYRRIVRSSLVRETKKRENAVVSLSHFLSDDELKEFLGRCCHQQTNVFILRNGVK